MSTNSTTPTRESFVQEVRRHGKSFFCFRFERASPSGWRSAFGIAYRWNCTAFPLGRQRHRRAGRSRVLPAALPRALPAALGRQEEHRQPSYRIGRDARREGRPALSLLCRQARGALGLDVELLAARTEGGWHALLRKAAPCRQAGCRSAGQQGSLHKACTCQKAQTCYGSGRQQDPSLRAGRPHERHGAPEGRAPALDAQTDGMLDAEEQGVRRTACGRRAAPFAMAASLGRDGLRR